MKLKNNLLAGAVLASFVALTAWSQAEPSHENFGATKAFDLYINIQIKNFQDESLGRITELGIDLVNGRIVEVLVESDGSLDVGGKIVAVPPLAFMPDGINEVYRLNVSTEVFKSAPAIDLSEWKDWGRSDRIVAAYRLFDEPIYFLEEGETANATAKRPKVALGYVERASKIVDLPVGNLQNEPFGKVWSLSMDIAQGRVRNVIVIAPGNFKTKSIVPPMALAFNAQRDALLLDQTKAEFANEPRYLFSEASFGQDADYMREAYDGPRTSVKLEQGRRYRDVDRTVAINRGIRAAKINGRNVQVGTMDDRVTLRGWVESADDKRRIEEIAVASRVPAIPEMVDNQIIVGRPVTVN
jgi:sporulation protein YlmC with PRC-barrel domain